MQSPFFPLSQFPTHTYPMPHICSHLLPIRKGRASQTYQPNTPYEDAIKPGTNPHIKDGQGNPVRGRVQQAGKEPETPLPPLLGVSQNT